MHSSVLSFMLLTQLNLKKKNLHYINFTQLVNQCDQCHRCGLTTWSNPSRIKPASRNIAPRRQPSSGPNTSADEWTHLSGPGDNEEPDLFLGLAAIMNSRPCFILIKLGSGAWIIKCFTLSFESFMRNSHMILQPLSNTSAPQQHWCFSFPHLLDVCMD